RDRGGRIDRWVHGHAPDDRCRAARPAERDLRAQGRTEGWRPPRGAPDRHRLRHHRMSAASAHDRDGGRERSAVPDAQGDHAGEAEAARAALGRRPRPHPRGDHAGAGGRRRRARRRPCRRRGRRGRGRGPGEGRRVPLEGEGHLMPGVWVYAEVTPDGKVDPSALELLTKARDLGAGVAAVALGPGATQAAPTLGEFGAETVYASDDAVFADYVAQPAAFVLHQLATEHQPELILFGPTYDSRDIAGRLQARTNSSLMTNVTDILTTDYAQTQIFGGTKIVDVTLSGPNPKLLIARPKAFAP